MDRHTPWSTVRLTTSLGAIGQLVERRCLHPKIVLQLQEQWVVPRVAAKEQRVSDIGIRDGTGRGVLALHPPPTPCSQPQNSLPNELRRFFFHLPKGTRCLVVFLHREIKAVKEEVN